jgi:nucleotide-binding universal stress UspA family protein
VHVVEEPARPGAGEPQLPLSKRIDLAEDQLQKMVSALHFDNVRCAMIVRAGDIRENILSLIKERDADLLILGTRSKDHKPDDQLGSVAEKLLRDIPCPVMTVGKYVRQDSFEGTHPRTVLFPTDFSETSRNALAYTECLTKHLAANLCLLHVDEDHAKTASTSAREPEFKALVKGMKDPGLVTEYITRSGHPAEVIAAVSMAKWADFIVMGVHGTDELDRSHKYGIAYDVIRSVRCPVFTVLVQDEVTGKREPATLMSKTA